VARIEMWSDLKKAASADISLVSGLYIGGGNTVKLLSEIHNAGFDQKLREICSRGMPVYGGSAGAIILGRTILTAPESKGLGLVDGFSIYCHYDSKKSLQEFSKNLKTKIIAIPEKSGVYLTNGGLEVVGYEPVAVFNNNNRFDLQPGEIRELKEF